LPLQKTTDCISYEQQGLDPQSLKAGQPLVRVPADLGSGEGPLPVSDGCFLIVSSFGGKGKELSGVFFKRVLIPLKRAASS
jgi:hypothetical protein